jgi:hypothetical protein
VQTQTALSDALAGKFGLFRRIQVIIQIVLQAEEQANCMVQTLRTSRLNALSPFTLFKSLLVKKFASHRRNNQSRCLRAPERLQIKKMHPGRSNKRDAPRPHAPVSSNTQSSGCCIFKSCRAQSRERSRMRSLIKMQAGHNSQAESRLLGIILVKVCGMQFRKWSSYLNNDTGKWK